MSTKIIAAKLGTSAGVTTIITRSSNPGNVLNIVRYLQKPAVTCIPSIAALESSSKASSRRESITDQTKSLNLEAKSTDVRDMVAPPLHTRFTPSLEPMSDRNFWLLHTPSPLGTLYIDKGAWKALQQKHGLLPAGVVDVDGNFAAHEPVRIVVVNRLRGSPSPDRSSPRRVSFDGPGQEVGRALVNYAAPEIGRIKGHQTSEIEDILGYADSDYIANRSHIVFFPEDSRPATPHYSDDGRP